MKERNTVQPLSKIQIIIIIINYCFESSMEQTNGINSQSHIIANAFHFIK